ncbi:MAG: ABC transporter substrate-binding protein [Acidobacteriota bacterium]|nr:ABC transporter substrate-binding protein [Acidobacteriota bacterium]
MKARFLFHLLFVLAIGCDRNEHVIQRADGRITGDAPRDGGTLVRRLGADIVTLNPVRASTGSDRSVHKYLYTPLIYLDRDLQPVPGLAASWTISPNGLVYRFALNAKATFSDGTPVRASDVLFTLRKITDPTSEAPQVAGFFEELDTTRTRAIDDHTIEVAFRRPLASQLMHFADVPVLPERIYANGDFNRDSNDLAVGSGPYKLVKRDPGNEIVLARREDYWREKPHIQNVVFKVIADHGTAWNALKLGQIDETIISSDTWLRERANPDLAPIIAFHRFYTPNYNFIAWNNRHPILADRRIRRALAMCVPRESIIRDLYHATARPISGPFTPDEYAFNPAVPLIRFDPAEARRILAEAGWADRNGDGVLEKNGRPFALELLIIPGSAATTQFTQTVQAEMKKVGIQIEIRAIDGAAHMQQVRAGNFDAAYLGWELDADPDPHSLFHSSQFPPRGQNFIFYSNPETDSLIDAARRELDLSKRKALYWRLHEVLAEDQPYTWTIQGSAKWGIRKRLRGVESSRATGFFTWYPGELGWWIQRKEGEPSRLTSTQSSSR